MATLGNENVRRLDVAVHNSQLVRRIQAVGDLSAQIQNLSQ